jgi:uncharacterized protein (DUF2147 family)
MRGVRASLDHIATSVVIVRIVVAVRVIAALMRIIIGFHFADLTRRSARSFPYGNRPRESKTSKIGRPQARVKVTVRLHGGNLGAMLEDHLPTLNLMSHDSKSVNICAASYPGTAMTIRKIAKLLRLSMLLVVSCAALTALAYSAKADEPTASGLWEKKTEAGKPVVWVLISEHGGTYEGAIAKRFLKPGDDAGAVCAKCVDDRRNEPLLGLTFIRGMKRSGLKYEGGDILDPRDGKIYSANMAVNPDGQTLILRGYMGISILGHDEIWYRLPDSAVDVLDASILAKYVHGAIPASSAASPAKSI